MSMGRGGGGEDELPAYELLRATLLCSGFQACHVFLKTGELVFGT
jgi:hypothetical protein